MFPSFLPSAVWSLQEPASIALARQIKRQAITTPLIQQSIPTTYVQQGTGAPPILLLHGFDSSVLEFRYLLPLLASKTATWAVDLLGSGFTERVIDLCYEPRTIKTHLYSFWKTLIHQPVILVGTSMGGAVAIDFTLTYPQCVNKLILINSVGFTGSSPLGPFLIPPLDFLGVQWWRQRKVLPLFLGTTFGGLDPTALEALRCATLHLDMPGWCEAIATFTKSGGYNLSAQQIAQIAKPTLILWGEADDVLGAHDAEGFNQTITHSQLIWIQNCGHVPHLEQPQIIAEQILKFSRVAP